MNEITTEIRNRVAEILLPPKRETVPSAAEKYVVLNTPGGYSGPWSNDLPHYMVQPAECLTTRHYNAVVFVGCAQSGKTQSLCDNWAAHTVTCDPADMMIVQPTQDRARDYSYRRIDRMLENCPEIKKRLRPRVNADNTHDKHFGSGMILSLAWPTKNHLSGNAIGKMALTDYDRMADDIGGDGSAFALSMKRTTTFLSRGMTLAESSPSKEVINANWKPTSAHEAPPTKGILGLYNTGDKRRLYCQCQECGEYWMPSGDISDMSIPHEGSLEERANAAGLICKNGCINFQENELALKKTFVWLKEGQTIDSDGVIHGDGIISKRATFWMCGWAAAFQKWRDIVLNYLMAYQTYEASGDEEALKGVYNLDMGLPYISQARRSERSAEVFQDKAEILPKHRVPEGVRFLTAAVDVQKRSFVVQVQGWGEELESWVIDRFSITVSKREDEEGEPMILEPASYLEDWNILVERVLNKRYPVDDDSGRKMGIKSIRCDSGGVDGVTDNAYEFWRRCKRKGMARKFGLLKGGTTKNAPRIKVSYPENTQKRKRLRKTGDVPVLMLNTERLKDSISSRLSRDDPGAGYIHFPDWLPDSFYDELVAEKKTPKGWRKEPGSRNESFDLLCYNYAVALELGAEDIDWDRPPAWAAEWDMNNAFADVSNDKPGLKLYETRVWKSPDPWLS